MSIRTETRGGPAPEARSWPLALLLTAFLWAGATVALILLPSPQSDEDADRPLYQSISLQLAPWGGGSADREGGVVSEAAGAAPADFAPAQPVAKASSVPEPNPSAPARRPAAVTSSTPPSPPSSLRPPPSSVQDSADPGASPSDRMAELEPAPLDPAALDSDAWESLFAQGDGRNYSSSAQAVAEGQPSSGPVSVLSSSLSGVAATIGAGDAGVAVSSTAGGRSQSDGPTAETSDAIASIAQAALATGEAGGGARGGNLGKVGAGTSGTDMELAGGGTRLLLEPAQPVIHISQENRRYIPGSLEVTISLTVSPEGLVLPGSIKITPESLIHPQVQGEIREQIRKWRFQAAEGSGQVSFKYNIIKK